MSDARRGAADDVEPFGARLRRLRTSARLSQAELAGDQVHASYVSLLESGRRTPTPPVLASLAARLGVPVEELRGDAGPDLRSSLVLAESALALGRSFDAVALLEPYDALLTRDRLVTDPTLFGLGIAYSAGLERSGRLDDATRVLERLHAAALAAPASLPSLPVALSLTRCYRDAGDLARAVDIGERALERLDGLALGDVEGHAALVSTVAGAYHERGDLVRAQLLLDELVRRADVEGTAQDRAAAFWNAALLAVDRGQAGEGLRLVEHAEVLLSDTADARWRARLQVSRSWVMLAQEPPLAAEARELLRTSMAAIRQHADALSVASAQENLARAELLLGRPEVARRHAVGALRGLDPEFRLERARALAVLGAASVALGEDAAGVESLESAAALLSEAEAPRQAAAVWRQLSEVYRLLGDSERALDAAERALDTLGLLREPLVAAVSDARPRVRAPRAVPSRASAPGAGRR